MSNKFFKNKVLLDIDAEEVTRVRESWIEHIFNNIEKLSTELYSSKESFQMKLAKVKEDHYKVKEDLRSYTDSEIDKLKTEFKEIISSIKKSIDSIDTSLKELDNTLRSNEMDRVKETRQTVETFNKRIESLREGLDGKISPVFQEVWTTKGKIAVWATILGIVIGATVTYIIRHF